MKIAAPKLGPPELDETRCKRWVSLRDAPFNAEVEAQDVSFKGLALPLFVHYYLPGIWRVSEKETGYRIASGGTKFLAIQAAKTRLQNFLNRRGLYALRKLIAQMPKVAEVRSNVYKEEEPEVTHTRKGTKLPAPIRFN